MICPQCQTSCPDGTSFCPNCDAVLDADLLSMSSEAHDDDGDAPIAHRASHRPRSAHQEGSARPRRRPPGEKSHAPQPAVRPERSPVPEERVRRRRPAPVSDSQGEGAPSAPESGGEASEKYVSKYAQYWVDDDPPPKKSAAASQNLARVQPSRADALAPAEPAFDSRDLNELPNNPVEMLASVWATFQAMKLPLKIVTASSLALFCFGIIPWSEVVVQIQFTDAKYMWSNAVAIGMALVSLVSVWLRGFADQSLLEKIPAALRNNLGLLPFVCGALSAACAVLSIFQGMFTKDMSVGLPAWLALFSAGGILVGTCWHAILARLKK